MCGTLYYGKVAYQFWGRGLVNASTDGEPGGPGMQQDTWPLRTRRRVVGSFSHPRQKPIAVTNDVPGSPFYLS